MKLAQLATVPELVKVVIDDKEIIDAFGEAIEFYVYDRQPLDIFMQLATVNEGNFQKIGQIIREIILDEDGNKILSDGKMLPLNIVMSVIQKVVEVLGNANSQTSKS